jgi:hypothetical protein
MSMYGSLNGDLCRIARLFAALYLWRMSGFTRTAAVESVKQLWGEVE